MNVFVKTVASVAMIATLTGAACAEEINFGIISTESQQNLKPKWEPFLADFAKMTGLAFHVEGPVGQFALGRPAQPPSHRR